MPPKPLDFERIVLLVKAKDRLLAIDRPITLTSTILRDQERYEESGVFIKREEIDSTGTNRLTVDCYLTRSGGYLC